MSHWLVGEIFDLLIKKHGYKGEEVEKRGKGDIPLYCG